ncbi:polysaccharide pyruvyl transferase family protein [Arthrobacter sp. Z1-15]
MTARIAVLADLGQDVYHAGDEAMGHAAADELRSRGLEVLLLSRNLEQTELLFGCAAAATLPFPWPPVEREAYLQQIRSHLDGTAELPVGDPARALIGVLSECDGVVVAGGGNLNSRYGWLLYERAAVVAVARALGKPVVISGQTLGPQLTAPDTIALAGMLESTELNSMREPASLQLARSLGAAAVAGLDDASFLAAEEPAIHEPAIHNPTLHEPEPVAPAGARAEALAEGLPENGYVAVTVSPSSEVPDDFAARLGEQLDVLYRQTGLPAVFIAHMGIGADRGWDIDSHAGIAAAMTTPSLQLPVLPARQVAALTAGASLVFTSRYHPAVFALSAGVPVLGLATDTYSGVRLAGAMENWGLADYVLPLPALREGLLGPALAETWQRRTDISAHLAAVLPSRSAWSSSWWDAVAAIFSAQPPAHGSVADLPGAPPFGASGLWLAAAQRCAAAFYPRSRMEAQANVEEDRIRSYTERQGHELADLQSEHRRLLSSRTVTGALSLQRAYARLFRR